MSCQIQNSEAKSDITIMVLTLLPELKILIFFNEQLQWKIKITKKSPSYMW